MLTASLVLSLVVSAPAAQPEGETEARKVAETYLNALTGEGDEAGKDLLLGGVTGNAQLFMLDNWQFKKRDAVRFEEGDLAHAVSEMNALDKAGHSALTKLMGVEQVGDDLKMVEVSQADAQKLLGPTKQRALSFQKHHPVLAYICRVGKEVYWHPKNPMRAVLARSGGKGKYTIEVYRWIILSKEGPGKTPREWPLRVLRFKSGKVDTGWKVLPASDWNAE